MTGRCRRASTLRGRGRDAHSVHWQDRRAGLRREARRGHRQRAAARPRRPRSPGSRSAPARSRRSATFASRCSASVRRATTPAVGRRPQRPGRCSAVAGGRRGGADLDHLGTPEQRGARGLQGRQRLRRRSPAGCRLRCRAVGRAAARSPAPPPPARPASCDRSTSTTAWGRVAGVSPGFVASATPAASATGFAPPSRVVFFVASPFAASCAAAGHRRDPRPAALAFGGQRLAAPRERRAEQQASSVAASRGGGEGTSETLPTGAVAGGAPQPPANGASLVGRIRGRRGTGFGGRDRGPGWGARRAGKCRLSAPDTSERGGQHFLAKCGKDRAAPCNRPCALLGFRRERRIHGQTPWNGGPKLLGRIPRWNREKRRLF